MAALSGAPITSPYAPNAVELRTWIERMIAALRFVELVTAVISLIMKMRDLNTELVRKVEGHRRRRPPSETLERLERQLVLEFSVATPEKAPPADAPKDETKAKPSRRGKHPGRAAFAAHLPRIIELNAVPAALRICPVCGRTMTAVSPSVCEYLDVIPAQAVVVQRHDECLACPADDTIVSAPPPPQLVERGKLSRRFIVEALANKYLDHQPIERQAGNWARSGVDIAAQTLGRSVAIAIDLLAPISALIWSATRGRALLSNDATGLRVLDRDHQDGVRTGTMWCWIGDARWVSFVYAPEGDAESVKGFLGNELARSVQCDGTNLMSFIERAGGKRPGCWSHGRRRFVPLAREGDRIALDGLRLIRRLFAVERLSAMCNESAGERAARRRGQSVPVLEELRAWLDREREREPPKTPLGKALGYLHRQWHRLILFLEDGRLELTNNHVERQLRRLVLGRRNWLFVEGDLGGQRAASILTIVGTCIAQGVNPRAYLHLVTKLIVEGWPQARIHELLPHRLATAHPELRVRLGALPGVPLLAASGELLVA